jgi:hypothetical protein
MIRLTLEMTDETYEQLRCGIKYGFFTFSLEDLVKFNIKVDSVQHYCGDQNND